MWIRWPFDNPETIFCAAFQEQKITVVPCKMMLICSAKIAVLQKHHLAKRGSPLECIEIYLIRSNGKIVVLRKSSIENIVL